MADDSDHGARHIRGGRRRPRDLLFMAATSAARFNADLVFERLETAGKQGRDCRRDAQRAGEHLAATAALLVARSTGTGDLRANEGDTALAPAEKQRRYRERRKSPSSTTEIPVVPVRNAGAMRWLGALQEHCRDSFDSLPDSPRDTACGERLQIIVEADIEILEEIEPPRG